MLAEMDVEAIKVERAPTGNGARLVAVEIDGHSDYFVQHLPGKKDVCLEAKTLEALTILKGMVEKAGVFRELRTDRYSASAATL